MYHYFLFGLNLTQKTSETYKIKLLKSFMAELT